MNVRRSDMHAQNNALVQQRLLPGATARPHPVSRREIAEKLFRHSAWVQRKPGAMWDVVPALSAAAR
ncbi:hypothetical protein EIL87_16330 [Saccharopolyspora rhizosphaerae]|uniref:Uncharacterized protein n=1 Tax=Saccharopolyspora rhizosphaerae TaxID=2492662 RepID=A0A426JR09_9PSEU|nr:hypothetical protein [Saccharopolyspora rhizosphaerae]RRO15589.1 hypothetical protein EIL87_16330 [Saccharopolyspora rhizosphaerae]